MSTLAGYWLSGAQDLNSFYSYELAHIRERAKNSDTWFLYKNYYIVLLSEKHDYALIRRSKELGNYTGKYIMLNLETGEETFIADSFTVKIVTSSMAELIEWIDYDTLILRVIVDKDSPSDEEIRFGFVPTTYLAIYDDSRWLVEQQ